METASAHNFNMMTTEFQGMDPMFWEWIGFMRTGNLGALWETC